MATPKAVRAFSGSELRQLLEWRRRLRDEVVGLPRVWQREVLRALEEARQHRLHGRLIHRTPPEMSSGELIREIKWRIDASALDECAAGVRALNRAERAHGARVRRLARRETGPL